MLASPVPIIVYVAPAAAQAGSAGTFITLAGHVAAMAPGSSIGAASPVGAAGEDVGETMEAKVKNILSADIENLAARRGDDAVEWAIAAVQEAAAATAEQALELGVIDFIAADVNELLKQVNGFAVTVQGETVTLQTDRAVTIALRTQRITAVLEFYRQPDNCCALADNWLSRAACRGLESRYVDTWCYRCNLSPVGALCFRAARSQFCWSGTHRSPRWRSSLRRHLHQLLEPWLLLARWRLCWARHCSLMRRGSKHPG